MNSISQNILHNARQRAYLQVRCKCGLHFADRTKFIRHCNASKAGEHFPTDFIEAMFRRDYEASLLR